MIEKIKKSKDYKIREAFEKFEKATKMYESDTKVEGKYCININSKRRYIVPLVKMENGAKRINKISKKANQEIKSYLNLEMKKYAYFDFNF